MDKERVKKEVYGERRYGAPGEKMKFVTVSATHGSDCVLERERERERERGKERKDGDNQGIILTARKVKLI